MNPPIRNWKAEDAQEEQKMYSYQKPVLTFKKNDKDEQKLLIIILEEIGANKHQKWDIDEFLEKYKILEKFLMA